MLTDIEKERCKAFKRWAETLPGDDKFAAAQQLTGMHMRTLQRIMSIKRPPPVLMLARLGDHAQANGHAELAAELVELGTVTQGREHIGVISWQTAFGLREDKEAASTERLRGSRNGYMAFASDEGLVEMSGQLDAKPNSEGSGNA